MPSVNDHFKYTVEEWQSDLFKKITDPLPEDIRVVFDVGANVGGWAHVMQGKYGNNLSITCFEPVKENLEMLKSKDLNITICPFGIFYGARESHVCSRGDGNCGGVFVEQIEAGDPIIKSDEIIQLRTFEELELPMPNLIKFDVEGAEENILEHSTLVKETPWLIVEWHPEHVDCYEFFKKHLPQHEIVVDLESKQFLLHKQ
jgi:FkbM family methyltransferase